MKNNDKKNGKVISIKAKKNKGVSMNTDDDTSNNENVIVFEKAMYRPQSNLLYQGNQYIEALPLVPNVPDFIKKTQSEIICSEEQRILPFNNKKECCYGLLDFFHIDYEHYQLFQKIDLAIRQGYYLRTTRDHALGGITNTGFCLIGISDCGKTKSMIKALKVFPDVIMHDTELYPDLVTYQLPKVVVQVSHDGDIDGLCNNAFEGFDNILGSMYFERYSDLSTNKKVNKLKFLLKKHAVGVIVFDEIQLFLQGKKDKVTKAKNFLISFSQRIGVPFICIGTPEIRNAKLTLAQDKRITGTELMHWTRMQVNKESKEGEVLYKSDCEFMQFMTNLFSYQWTDSPLILTQEVAEEFYRNTAAIKGLCVKLYILVQIKIIESEWKCFNINKSLSAGDVDKAVPELISSKLIRSISKVAFGKFQKKIDTLVSYDSQLKNSSNIVSDEKFFDDNEDIDVRALDVREIGDEIFPDRESAPDKNEKEKHFRQLRDQIHSRNSLSEYLRNIMNVSEAKSISLAEYVLVNNAGKNMKDLVRIALDLDISSIESIELLSPKVNREEVCLLGCDTTMIRNTLTKGCTAKDIYHGLLTNNLIADVKNL
ncbi:TniB family NTP-binding protein [Endozoicomonas euniceicola]|uniref:TniB family NTP-binding protein n=1 Tax=Endozoicomonas euniceicola TaxID=1234143 RepID=A0ABY6GV65_9GAMM|nr:TniB family NTP-binding protein [Endozoicomonas euniceicola]UYM16284.1 TniB family NTP-binding protein [Endozoicomonas euniceicola]